MDKKFFQALFIVLIFGGFGVLYKHYTKKKQPQVVHTEEPAPTKAVSKPVEQTQVNESQNNPVEVKYYNEEAFQIGSILKIPLCKIITDENKLFFNQKLFSHIRKNAATKFFLPIDQYNCWDKVQSNKFTIAAIDGKSGVVFGIPGTFIMQTRQEKKWQNFNAVLESNLFGSKNPYGFDSKNLFLKFYSDMLGGLIPSDLEFVEIEILDMSKFYTLKIRDLNYFPQVKFLNQSQISTKQETDVFLFLNKSKGPTGLENRVQKSIRISIGESRNFTHFDNFLAQFSKEVVETIKEGNNFVLIDDSIFNMRVFSLAALLLAQGKSVSIYRNLDGYEKNFTKKDVNYLTPIEIHELIKNYDDYTAIVLFRKNNMIKDKIRSWEIPIHVGLKNRIDITRLQESLWNGNFDIFNLARFKLSDSFFRSKKLLLIPRNDQDWSAHLAAKTIWLAVEKNKNLKLPGNNIYWIQGGFEEILEYYKLFRPRTGVTQILSESVIQIN